MDAAPPTTIAWVEPARGAADTHALDEWALARGVHLATPSAGVAPELAVDLRLADGVEDEIDRARDAVAAQEIDAAERALARAEETLRAHPELPNAAWLMAEVHRLWSSRWRRLEPHDALRADAAWRRAAALDGGRVDGVGERAASPEPPVHAQIDVVGVPDGARVLLDGQPIVDRPAGEHQLTVTDGGVVRYAAWVSLAAGTVLRVRVPSAPACSTPDVGRARLAGDSVSAAGVRCGSWVAVAPSAGALRIAMCEEDRCGPLVEWRALGGALPSAGGATDEPHKNGRWPGWATFTIFGAGVVIATTVALAATGAFDKQRGEPRFVNGGLKIQGF